MKPNLHLIVLMLLFSIGDLYAQGGRSLVLYSSADGTSFSFVTQVQDSADVPSMAVDSTGKIYCAFQNFAGGTAQRDSIGIRNSTDGGLNWSPRTIARFSGVPGIYRMFDPTLRILADGRFRMYFSYCPNSTLLDSTCDTYSAISTDGQHFLFEAGQRYDRQDKQVIDPTALWFAGKWHYTTPAGPPQEGALYARASDGLNFSLIDTIPSDFQHNWTGNLMSNGPDMRFYGTGTAGSNYIWWSASADGTVWSPYNNTNITGKDPAIYKFGPNDYKMIVPKDTTILVGLPALDFAPQFLLYPQPASGQVFVRGPLDRVNNWRMSDLQGRICKEGKALPGVLEVGMLASGLYVLELVLEDGDWQRMRIRIP